MPGAVVSSGRTSLSRIFTAEQSSKMGLYDSPASLGLAGFRVGRMTEFFNIAGRSAPATEILKSSMRKARISAPKLGI